MENQIQELTKSITVPTGPIAQVQGNLDQLTKPPGSLGELENLVLWLGKCQNTETPKADKKQIYVFAGDHGVTAEGVSPYPSEVTAQMVGNMLSGGAAISVLAKSVGADLTLVDLGVLSDLEPHEQLLMEKVKKGTANFSKEPAMTDRETLQAIQVGFKVAKKAKSEGADLLGIGEMGIGNTTAATAIYANLLGLNPVDIAGAGTGLDAKGITHKAEIVISALELHRPTTAFDCLAKVGGLEIAGLTGLCLGAAKEQIPLLVDGFIATAAALVAIKICPAAEGWLLFSHSSNEQGHKKVLAKMGVTTLLDLQLRLGEGTGAALAMGLTTQALELYYGMASFANAGVSDRE
ncbi:MAG: nicotinate-nucleotide--dimethylbenzimidazole phosphoribosyltransferase [SAR324 cluster bacterium]|nr:nicotinate-nucleotide--dimethylbenzimidazole phosphoribosyltransferase [SAR324 cluster bacterium]